jgi:hypothetical protein
MIGTKQPRRRSEDLQVIESSAPAVPDVPTSAIGSLSVNQFRFAHSMSDTEFDLWLQKVFVPAVMRGEKPGRSEWNLLRMGAHAAIREAQEGERRAAEFKAAEASKTAVVTPVLAVTPEISLPQAPVQAKEPISTAKEAGSPNEKAGEASPSGEPVTADHLLKSGTHAGKLLLVETGQSVDAFRKEYGLDDMSFAEWRKLSLPFIRQSIKDGKLPDNFTDPSWSAVLGDK